MTSNPTQGELDTILDTMPRVRQRARGLEDPLMPFETNLQLTKTQEDRLVQHVLHRFDQLNVESGRYEASITDEAKLSSSLGALHALGLTAHQAPWMLRRALYYRHFYNNYSDRVQPDTIYEVSNVTASLSPRVTMQVAGKLKRALYGNKPFFSAAPVGDEDVELARSVRDFTRYKADEAELLPTLTAGVDLACIVGESVIKTTFVDERLWFWRNSPILVDAGGTPRFDSKGNYIFQEDRFAPEMAEQQAEDGSPVLAPTGRMVLKKDSTVIINPDDRWEQRRVRVGDQVYRGARSQGIFYTDFMAPMTATCVHEADICFHLYDKPAMEVASWFLQGRFTYLATQGEVSVKAADALKILRDLAGTANGTIGNSDATNPREVHGEPDLISSPGNSGLVQVVEAWVRFDADEDGVQEELVIMVDPRTRLPLFYEYTGMVTDDRRRPFTVKRVLPVYGRWYGQGVMEYLEAEQSFIDRLVNRWNVTLSQSGQVTFWDPSKTVEGQNNKDLVLNAGKTYRLHGGALAEEVLKVVEIYAKDRANDLRGMIEFFMQLMQLKTGVLSVADESISNMESSKLATGIRSLERSGNEMFESWLSETARGAVKVVTKFVTVTLMRMDERETYQFTDGENAMLAELSREDVLGLRMNVEIMIATDEGERVISSTMGLLDIMERVVNMSALAPDTVAALKPVLVEAARALKIPNPEEVIVLPTPMVAPPAALAPAGAPGEPGEPPPQGGAPMPPPAAAPVPAPSGGRAQGKPADMALQALPDMF